MNDIRCEICNKKLAVLSFGYVEIKCPKCGNMVKKRVDTPQTITIMREKEGRK
jgi:phage FluMu protein Com